MFVIWRVWVDGKDVGEEGGEEWWEKWGEEWEEEGMKKIGGGCGDTVGY